MSRPFAQRMATELVTELNRTVFPAITKVELFLTYDCVLDCDYCYVKKEKVHVPKTMPSRVACSAVDFLLKNSRDKNRLQILFFGGEPLLGFSLIREVVEYVAALTRETDKVVNYNLTTSGVLLDEEKLAFFKEHGIKVLLSLDGGRASHDRHRKMSNGEGSYDRIMSRIPLIKQYQPWVGARMTVSPDNVCSLSDDVEELYAKGVNQFIICAAEGIVWDDAVLENYYRQLENCVAIWRNIRRDGGAIRLNFWEDMWSDDFTSQGLRWGCRAGRQSVAIDTNGDIYPCSKMFFPKELKDECRLGTLQNGLEGVGRRLRFCHFSPRDHTDCDKCHLSNICTGGCYAENYWMKQNMFAPFKEGQCRHMEWLYSLYGKLYDQIPKEKEVY